MCECACPFAERAASVACVSVLVLCVIDTLRAAPITMRCVKCGSMSLVANRDPRRVPASFVMMKSISHAEAEKLLGIHCIIRDRSTEDTAFETADYMVVLSDGTGEEWTLPCFQVDRPS